MPSGYSGNDNRPKKKTEHIWGRCISNTKAFWPWRLSGRQMPCLWWGLKSPLVSSLSSGWKLEPTFPQAQNLHRKNSLDFDNSGATSGLHGLWSFVILLRHDFTPHIEAAVRVIFSLWRKPSNPPCPQHRIQPFLSLTIHLQAYCVPNAVLGPGDAAQDLDLQGECSYQLYYFLPASIIYTTLKR